MSRYKIFLEFISEFYYIIIALAKLTAP